MMKATTKGIRYVSILLTLLITPLSALQAAPKFSKAVPVWPKGRELAMNDFVRFRTSFDRITAEPVLRVTGSSVYRIRLNGDFVGYGPARGGRGIFLVDEWPLAGVRDGKNELEIEVAGYNINSFYLMDQPSFLQAEIIAGNDVLAATDVSGAAIFTCEDATERVRKVNRYSFQRMFGEVYRLPAECSPLKLARCADVRLAERLVPYPDFSADTSFKPVRKGRMQWNADKKTHTDRCVEQAGLSPNIKGFKKSELDVNLFEVVQRIEPMSETPCAESATYRLSGETILFQGIRNETGFIHLDVTVAKPGRLVIRFDEVAVDGKFHPMRTSNHGTGNAVQWELLSPGRYRLETFEPYTLKFMDVTVMNGGEMEIAAPWLRRYINRDASRARFSCSDRDLCNIFEAARATFAQNAVDVFTDCPSRERAGWLCDSYFTARVAQLLCGDTRLEKQFLTNFLAEKRFAPLPEGVFPMCYPGDHPDGGFIVNWNLWLVLEMEEYLARSGDRELVDAFRPRFQKLFGYLHGFRNSDGLLENEPGWVFVEWSKANDFTKDVNYPSNMLYAEALDAFARMYNDTESAKEAAAVRVTVCRQSWNGMWFRDHAVRSTDGKLEVKDDISETCQYYAFFTHVADFTTHSALWQRLIDEFGPSRDAKKIHPTIWPSNMFIGMYLRFELLSRAGLGEKILSDMRANLAKMAAMTGTLWEHNWPIFSLNHGFASHAAIFLSRDILGVTRIDVPNKTLTWHETDVATKSVEMVIPVPGGEIVAVRRQTAAGRFAYDFTLPAGWRAVKQKKENDK